MQATIQCVNNQYLAIFERQYNFPPVEVWSWLTENKKLKQWFPELHIENLQKNGLIKFDMGDGTFEEMIITDYQTGSILAFTWGDDSVRFELSPENNGSRLIFIEFIKKVNEHTPRDLAGWHVCLDVIHALMEKRTIDRKLEWEKWYAVYKEQFQEVL